MCRRRGAKKQIYSRRFPDGDPTWFANGLAAVIERTLIKGWLEELERWEVFVSQDQNGHRRLEIQRMTTSLVLHL